MTTRKKATPVAAGPAGALAAYVDAACAQHALVLAPDERERVLVQYARLAAIAAPLLAVPLPDDTDPAPVFRA
jgi:hypothetical protein